MECVQGSKENKMHKKNTTIAKNGKCNRREEREECKERGRRRRRKVMVLPLP